MTTKCNDQTDVQVHSESNKQLLFTSSDIIQHTGLSEKQLRRMVTLGVIDPPRIKGRGAKRYTYEDLRRLTLAGELLRLQKTPRKIAELLKNEETFMIKGVDLISAIATLESDPTERSWTNFVQSLLNIEGLSDQEKVALRYVIEKRDWNESDDNLESKANLSDDIDTFASVYGVTMSVDDLRRIKSRLYQKVGYSIISLMRLRFLQEIFQNYV